MPELRSGARRSRRLDDQPNPPLIEQAENNVLPPQTATRRRGGGRGRGNAALVKGVVRPRPTAAGRGRGIRLTDLEPEPCEVRPAAGALGATEPALNRVEGVADKDIAAEGGSAEKIVGMEEDSSMGPVPERVYSVNLMSYDISHQISARIHSCKSLGYIIFFFHQHSSSWNS